MRRILTYTKPARPAFIPEFSYLIHYNSQFFHAMPAFPARAEKNYIAGKIFTPKTYLRASLPHPAALREYYQNLFQGPVLVNKS